MLICKVGVIVGPTFLRMVREVRDIQWCLVRDGFRVLRKEKLKPKEVDGPVQHQPDQRSKVENE